MNWEQRLMNDGELAPFLPPLTEPCFVHRVRALINQQKEAWPLLRDGLERLSEVRTKEFSINGSKVLAQNNPQRMLSTSALVDAQSIKQRPCFLCVQNLPPEEKGITFAENFVVLCNPFPVLRDHLVISAKEHRPQVINGNFEILLDLARDLGRGWITLYNGPKCGASAPDHLHFQACSIDILPIIPEIETWERKALQKNSHVEVFTLRNYRLNQLIARGTVRAELTSWFDSTLSRLARFSEEAGEPMINLIAYFDLEKWTIILFPRSKHRPSCYYAESDARLMVSPAAIDLAGVLVVPREEDYNRITAEDLERIYAEVTLSVDWEDWID
jgi:Domain of unknown function (DUF4922)